MVIFLFIIFFNFFNLLCSNVNKYNISYNYLNEAETISDCSDYLIGIKYRYRWHNMLFRGL